MYYYPTTSTASPDREAEAGGVAGAAITASDAAPVAKMPAARRVVLRSVLVPVDGSDSALRAVAHLLEIVHRRAPPEIHLLNVQPQIMSGDVGPLVTTEMVKYTRLATGEEILRRARGLLDRAGVLYVASILFGVPAETIVRYVEDHEIDAVFMGTRGMSALRNLLLGSVATKVVGSAQVPVTLVK